MEIVIETSGNIDGGWLTKLLNDAGIANSGVTPNGFILTLHGIDPAQEQAARDVVATYDPNAHTTFLERVSIRFQTAIQYLKAYTWARTTQSEWQDYFDQNLSDTQVDTLVATITNIVTAQEALRTMWKKQNAMIDRLTKVEIAVRDIVKPDNPET